VDAPSAKPLGFPALRFGATEFSLLGIIMKQHRIDALEEINPSRIAEHIEAGERVIVQYSKSSYSVQQLELLNQLAKSFGRSFEIRFYGHYSEVFDASVLRIIPDAQCVSIDCLMEASNLEALSNIRNLAELSLGVFELTDPNVLRYCNLPSLKVLSLGGTRKCNIDFRHLSTCVDLEMLHTTGHVKNISTICDLPFLRDLSLSSIKKKDDIDFVSDLPRLKSLRFILGGRASLAQVTSPQLESLEVIRVQGLEDIGNLDRFENLKSLLIEDQIRLAGIRVGPNSRLMNMKIINCKTLETISGIDGLKMLSSLRVYKTAIDYDKFVGSSIPSSLKDFAFFTGKSKRDSEIRSDLKKRGFLEFPQK
jgi:hypothetical protein